MKPRELTYHKEAVENDMEHDSEDLTPSERTKGD